MVEALNAPHASYQEPPLCSILRRPQSCEQLRSSPWSYHRSGSLVHGAKLMAQCLDQEPTPQQMAPCARERRALFQEVGRRLVAWVLHHVEPECPEEAPPRLWLQGRASRRRRTHRATMATLVGPVVVWRRLYDPLGQGARAMPPLEIRGVLTPASPPPRWLNASVAGRRWEPIARRHKSIRGPAGSLRPGHL